MNIRIQTYGISCLIIPHLHQLTKLDADNVSVYDVLEKGLNDLMDLCDVVMDKFTIARDEFAARDSQEITIMGCALRAFYMGSGAQKGNVVLAYVQKSLAQELSRLVPPLYYTPLVRNHWFEVIWWAF